MPRRSSTIGLRALRAAYARAAAAVLETWPALEPAFIATGRWLTRRSARLGTLYWFAQDDLLRRLRASGRRFRTLPVAGVEMQVDVTDGTGRLHYFYDQPYEPELAHAIRDRLRPGDVFLDVGANAGYFSVLAGHVVGEAGRVIACEPHPGALAVLRQAAIVNGLTKTIEIVDAAAGATSGTTRLFLSDDSVLSTTDPARSPARTEFAFPRAIDVRQITVDGWFGARPDLLHRLHAIKIDVEGTEADVLEGMRITLGTAAGAAVFCETSAGSAADAFLRARGYAVTALDVRRGAFGNYRYERRP